MANEREDPIFVWRALAYSSEREDGGKRGPFPLLGTVRGRLTRANLIISGPLLLRCTQLGNSVRSVLYV